MPAMPPSLWANTNSQVRKSKGVQVRSYLYRGVLISERLMCEVCLHGQRDLLREAPTGEEIAANYDPTREFILPQNDWPARLVPR